MFCIYLHDPVPHPIPPPVAPLCRFPYITKSTRAWFMTWISSFQVTFWNSLLQSDINIQWLIFNLMSSSRGPLSFFLLQFYHFALTFRGLNMSSRHDSVSFNYQSSYIRFGFFFFLKPKAEWPYFIAETKPNARFQHQTVSRSFHKDLSVLSG